MRVTAIAGGVGGAKLIAGMVNCLTPENLTIIVNSGDDFNFLSLKICPDIDTICYTLAGISNPETGWGQNNDSWHALQSIRHLGGPDWFQIGDKDLGTHLERTRRLLDGESLSQVIHHFCEAWRIKYNILPMTDDTVSTIIRTIDRGDLSFQDYFVKNKCEPIIRDIKFKGIRTAKPAPGVLDSIEQADLIVICPSNPWVSIDPVLSVKGILSRIRKKPTIAVSPIIQGRALKGPAAKMFFELGIEPSALAVADHYQNTIRGLVIDQLDANYEDAIFKLGITPFITNTRMISSEDRTRLAQDVLNFSERIIH